MRYRTVGSIILALSLRVASRVAEAQPAGNVTRIGYLAAGPSAPSLSFAALRQGLSELGWVEGQNLAIEPRWAEGRQERLPDLAAELVQLHVKVIVATSGPAGQ